MYLDSPLIAHADAALSLRDMYDSVVSIQGAGEPYGDIFKIMGYEVFPIDFSHHKRNMNEPQISKDALKRLQEKKKTLLVDIDILTGKTTKKVQEFLTNKGINSDGIYLGLSRWPGLEETKPSIGEDSVNFNRFWKQCGNLRILSSKFPYNSEIISPKIKVFTSSGNIEKSDEKAYTSARRVAKYLIHNERR